MGGGVRGRRAGTTELDSCANMVVIGAQGTIIQKTGRYADLNAFSSDVGTLSRVPIVDAAVAYDCPFSGQTILMVARNALHVDSMGHNLVPPFIMRKAGLEVDERAKIHTPQPSKEQHSVYCREIDLRIPLKIEGIVLVFETRRLNATVIAESGEYDIVFISPDADSWNPNCETWGDQEDMMLDQDGDIIQYEAKKPV